MDYCVSPGTKTPVNVQNQVPDDSVFDTIEMWLRLTTVTIKSFALRKK